MAYQHIDSPASIGDVLGPLAAFLAAAGWTLEAAATSEQAFVKCTANLGGGPCDYRFSIYTSGSGNSAAINVAGRTGYTSGAAPASQPGHRAGPILSCISGPMKNAWFFADSKCCHVVLEVQLGFFSSIHFGALDMAFAPPASDPVGQFVFGGYNSSSYAWSQATSRCTGNLSLFNGVYTTFQSGGLLRLTTASGAQWSAASGSPKWLTNLDRGSSSGAVTSSLCPLVIWPRLDGSRPLMPITVYGEHLPAQTPNYFLYGTVPNLRTLYFYGLLNAQELDIGGQTWVCFPVLGQNPNVTAISGNQQFGLALRKF